MIAVKYILEPPRFIPLNIGFISLCSLAFAFIAEHFFDIRPCPLCYYQRYIYWALAGVSLLPLFSLKTLRITSALQTLLIIGGIGLSIFHIGIENHWWTGPASCTGGIATDLASIEDLKKQLLKRPIPRCDKINWTIFGVSATYWNLLLQIFLLGLVCLRLAYQTIKFPPIDQK
jgi:disulfide bond formation protein DsbB